MNTVRGFVFSAIHPKVQGPLGISLERPENVESMDFWLNVQEEARSLGVLLPVFLGVDRSSWSSEVPEKFRAKMTEVIERRGLLSELAVADLRVITDRLLSQSIPVLLLGDVDLRRRFYPEKILRSIQKLDVMVPRESFSQALRLLGQVGYRLTESFVEGKPSVSLSRKLEAPPVVLRWAFRASESEMEIASYWDRSQDSNDDDFSREVGLLSPEDAFLFEFFRRESLGNLTMLLDLYAVLSNSQLRLNSRELDLLGREQMLSRLALCFSLLQRDWGLDLSERVNPSIDRRLDPVRKQALASVSSVEDWYEEQFNRGTLRRIRSRWLLGENLFQAVQREWKGGARKNRAPLSIEESLGIRSS